MIAMLVTTATLLLLCLSLPAIAFLVAVATAPIEGEADDHADGAGG